MGPFSFTSGVARWGRRAASGVFFWGLVAFCALAGEAGAQNPATAVYPAAVATDNELLCWANDARTRLSSAIDADDMTLPVWGSAGFCAPSVVQIGSELIKISAVSAGSLTVATGGRGFNGTTAASHYSSMPVKGYVAAAWLNQVSAELKALQATLGANLSGLSIPDDLGDLTGDSDDVAEGATNLYFTQARARAAVSGGANVTYAEGTGVIAVNAFPYGSLSGVPATFAPSAHASAHQFGGADILSLAGLSVAWADLTGVPASFAPSAHAALHQFGGGDVLNLAGLSVAWGDLTGVPATFTPSAHAASHGVGQADAVTITEAQISDLSHFDGAYGSLSGVPTTFAPTAHAAAHESGGGDALTLGNLTGTLNDAAVDAVGATFGAGFGVDYDAPTNTMAFDPTEVANPTWAAGGTAEQTWTVDLSGVAVDPTITFKTGEVEIGGTLDATAFQQGGSALAFSHIAGMLSPGQVATGTPDGTKFLRDDLTWQAVAGGGASALNDLTDVTAPAPASGDGLHYNGTAWVNTALFTAGTADLLAARMSGNVKSALETAVSASVLNLDGGFEVADFRCTGAAGVLTCQDPTAGTGITTLLVKGGANQGASPMLQVQNSTGADRLLVADSAVYLNATAHFASTTLVGARVSIASGVQLGSTFQVCWKSGASSATGACDAGVDRLTSGVIKASDGSTGYGKLDAAGFRISGGATSGNVLRGNGTDFVSAKLNYSDLAGAPSEANNLEVDGAAGIANAEVFIGTGAGTGNYAAISGDATLTNAGVLAVVDDSHAHTGSTISGLDTADVTTGTFADARIAQTNVTQHQAALALAASQVTSGTFADARISATSVSQHITNKIAFTHLAGGDPVAFRVPNGATVTGGYCYTDTGTVTFTVYETSSPFAGTTPTVLTLSCDDTGDTGTLGDTAIASGAFLRFVPTSEAGGMTETYVDLVYTE